MADQPDNEHLGPAFVKLAAILLVGFIAPVLDLTIVNVAVATIGPPGSWAPWSAS